MSSTPTMSEETWQFLVRYEHYAGVRINLQALEKASGLKYKTIWGKMDKAKKALVAEGFVFGDVAATTAGEGGSPAKGGKRKAGKGAKGMEDGDEEDDEEGGPPKKKGKGRGGVKKEMEMAVKEEANE